MGGNEAQADFAINLEDGTSGVAEAAAGSLERLRTQIEGDVRALKAMQAAMKNLQGSTVVNVQQFRQLQTQIAAKKQAVASAQGAFVSLGGTFVRTATSSRSASDRFAELAATARGMPGPLSALTGRLDALRGLLAGGAIAVGIAAIVAGLVLLVAATAAAVISLAQYGLAQANARRSELLRLEGITKLRNWYGIAAGNAGELQEAIDRVSGSVAIGRDKVAGYAEQLYRMHLRGDNLAAALEGVAIKAAVQGDAQAKMFAGWAAGAALTGHSVRKLADNVKARLGGIAARQMLDLNVLSVKLHESFDELFAGLKIEPFLKGLHSITELFSQNTATGRALKVLLEAMLQPLIDSAGTGAPLMKRFFQGITIGALQIGIAFQQVRLWFKRTFGGSDLLKNIDLTRAALMAGRVAVGLFAAGLAASALALASIVGLAALIAAPIMLAGVAVWALIRAGQSLSRLWNEIDWATLGIAITDGIVAGVKKGAKAVMDAVKWLGSSQLKAFRQALGISSPSKAFAELGAALPKGVEVGVHKQTPAARRAVANIVRTSDARAGVSGAGLAMRPRPQQRAAIDLTGGAPRLGEPEPQVREPTPAAAAPPSSSKPAMHFGDIHIHTKSERPRELAIEFRRELERMLEGAAIELGARIPGAT